MRKAVLMSLCIFLGLVGCQRPKPTVIVPQATLPVSSPTVEPMGTPTALSPSPTSTLVATPTPSPTPTPEVVLHLVAYGETLFSIAQFYGVSWEALAAANEISYPYWIYVGQELVIPGAEEAEATPVAGQVYVVQYGDTLFSISRAFGVPLDDLVEANDLSYPYTIYVGQRLAIP